MRNITPTILLLTMAEQLGALVAAVFFASRAAWPPATFCMLLAIHARLTRTELEKEERHG